MWPELQTQSIFIRVQVQPILAHLRSFNSEIFLSLSSLTIEFFWVRVEEFKALFDGYANFKMVLFGFVCYLSYNTGSYKQYVM